MIKIKVYAIIFKIRFLIQSLQVFCKPLQADQSFLRDSSLCEDSQRLGTETNIINYLTLLWSSIVSFILIEASFSWVRTLNSLVSCADFNSATESSIFLISSVISLTVLLSASSLARISSLKLVFIFSTSVYHKKALSIFCLCLGIFLTSYACVSLAILFDISSFSLLSSDLKWLNLSLKSASILSSVSFLFYIKLRLRAAYSVVRVWPVVLYRKAQRASLPKCQYLWCCSR